MKHTVKAIKKVMATVSQADIEEWIKKASESVKKNSIKEFGSEDSTFIETLDFKKGPKFYNVWKQNVSGTGSRSAYCFIDMEGNIYKAAGWGTPAKGIRGNIATVDPTKLTSSTAWLYRKM